MESPSIGVDAFYGCYRLDEHHDSGQSHQYR